MPLNQRLFRALERAFGRGRVRVVRPGVKMRVKYETEWDEHEQPRERMRRVSTGEEYRLPCPICRDYKPRLSISYMWGEPDRNDRINLWPMQCWNENCFSDFTARKEFCERLYADDDGSGFKDTAPEYASDETLVRKGKPGMPGKLWRLDKLALKSPRHPAVLYAQSRLMDIDELGAIFGVGFCPDPRQSAAENRLIAPVTLHGRLAGWTGRYFEPSRPKSIPKWYHDPNMEKSKLLYNFDNASRHHTKFLVEGPGSVWGSGTRGLAVLGKTISDEQVELLRTCCSGEAALVLLLDPKQDAKAVERGDEHHMQKALRKLKQQPWLAGKLFAVYLPDELDPGEVDRAYLFGLVNRLATQQRVKVVLHDKIEIQTVGQKSGDEARREASLAT